jgi:hypothetical protein
MTIILAVLNWLSHYQDWIRAPSLASQTLQWPLDDPHGHFSERQDSVEPWQYSCQFRHPDTCP